MKQKIILLLSVVAICFVLIAIHLTVTSGLGTSVLLNSQWRIVNPVFAGDHTEREKNLGYALCYATQGEGFISVSYISELYEEYLYIDKKDGVFITSNDSDYKPVKPLQKIVKECF